MSKQPINPLVVIMEKFKALSPEVQVSAIALLQAHLKRNQAPANSQAKKRTAKAARLTTAPGYDIPNIPQSFDRES